jgi:hypothetical protein
MNDMMTVNLTVRMILGCTWMVCAASLAVAEDDTQQAANNQQTDQQLLDDLQNDLLEGIELAKPPNEVKKNDQPSRDAKTKPLSIGGATDGDPLTAIGRKMLDVGRRLAQEDSSLATQAQQKQILEDLKKLITNAQQRKGSSSARGGSSTKTTAPKQLGKTPSGQKDSSAKAGATVESTERLGKADSKKVDPAEIRQRVEASWGVLPEQVREQMRHAAGDDFLGEFELMIENYFKRLAEPEVNRP